jgi:tetratricopeptide (TPR) repeat protein
VIGLRRGKWFRASAGVAAAAVAIWPARSISAEPTPRVALQSLETSPAGDRFFLSPDAAVPKRSAFSAKLFESYAYRPLLRVDTPSGVRDIVSSELYFDVGASYSLLGRALFALDLPIVPFRGGEVDEGASLGDLRLTARVRMASTRHFDFGTETRVFVPTGNPDALTSDGLLRVGQLATVSGRFSRLLYAASVGYLARKRVDLYGTEMGPSLPFSAAVGVDIAGRLQIGPEIQGYTVFGEDNTPVLGLLGVRFRSGGLVVGAGAGPGLSHAPGSAPHVVFSMAWEPPPRGRGTTVQTSVPPEPTIPLATIPRPAASPPTPATFTLRPIPSLPPAPAPAPASASAPLPVPPTPEETRLAARELFQQGIASYDAGNYEEAAAHFAKAYEMKPHPAVLRNLALSELMLGRHAEACTHFKRWRVEARPRAKDLRQIAGSIEEACR